MRLLLAELILLPAAGLTVLQVEENPLAAVGLMGVLLLAVGALFKVLMQQQKDQAVIIIAAKDGALAQCERDKSEVIARLQAQIDWLRTREADRDRQIAEQQQQVVALLSASTEKTTLALQASTTALQAMNESTTVHIHQAGAEHAALLDVIQRVASGALTPREAAAEIEEPHAVSVTP